VATDNGPRGEASGKGWNMLRGFPRTLVLLITRPGYLARAWSLRQRSDLVSPVGLYAILALVFFLVWPHWGGANRYVTELFQNASSGHAVGRRMPDLHLDPPVANFLIRHLLSVISLVLLPWAAAVVRVTHPKSRGFADAVVFALDFHSFAFLCGLVTAPLVTFRPPAGAEVVALGCAVFLVASLRGAYETSWLQSIVKGAVVSAWYLLGIFLLGLLTVPLRLPF